MTYFLSLAVQKNIQKIAEEYKWHLANYLPCEIKDIGMVI